jgi:hypothetical protein
MEYALLQPAFLTTFRKGLSNPLAMKRITPQMKPAPFSLTAFGVNGPTLRFSVVGPLTHREAGRSGVRNAAYPAMVHPQ